jgi:hypothetical protein
MKKLDLEEGSCNLEESIPRKKAKVDDPLSRIDPSQPLVKSACLPGALEPKTITESNHSQKQPAGKSEVGDLASCLVESEKEDHDLKPSAENGNMETDGDLKIMEDENTDTDTDTETTSNSNTDYTAKPKKGRPKRVIKRPCQKRRTWTLFYMFL